MNQSLKDCKILITLGPTYETIDSVRFIGNYSSGKQGVAIAHALNDLGAKVTAISGPISDSIKINDNIKVIRITTAEEMLAACLENIEQDVIICAAAVADYKISNPAQHKIKKNSGKSLNELTFVENPDILHTISHHQKRPKIVIGFAAETENLIENAKIKLEKKNCDLIVANDVAKTKIFGSNQNKVALIEKDNVKYLELMEKTAVAQEIAKKIQKKL